MVGCFASFTHFITFTRLCVLSLVRYKGIKEGTLRLLLSNYYACLAVTRKSHPHKHERTNQILLHTHLRDYLLKVKVHQRTI